MLTVTIPGEPIAQGRPRFRRGPKFVVAYDPAKSRNWKAEARAVMAAAIPSGGALPFPDGPLYVSIEAVFTCPKSAWKKRVPTPREAHAKRPDWENVAKAVCDAGTGVWWREDSQIALAHVEKWQGAQGEAPYVRITVTAISTGPER